MLSINGRINNSDVTVFANAYADWIIANAKDEVKPFTAMALPVSLQFFGQLKDCATKDKVETVLSALVTSLTTIGAPKIGLVAQDCKTIKSGDKTLSDYANVYLFELPKVDNATAVELPDSAAIAKVLAKVKNIDATKLDAIADWIVNEHKPKTTDDLLYFVEYSHKDAASTAIVAASNLTTLAAKVFKK